MHIDFDLFDGIKYPESRELETVRSPKEGEFIRFSFLPNPSSGRPILRRGVAYWSGNAGYRQCSAQRDGTGKLIGPLAACCSQNLCDWRFAGLVINYTCVSRTTGAFLLDTPLEFEISALCFSRSGYRSLGALGTTGSSTGAASLVSMDILATNPGEKKALVYSMASPVPTYKGSASLERILHRMVEPFLDGRLLNNAIGLPPGAVNYAD